MLFLKAIESHVFQSLAADGPAGATGSLRTDQEICGLVEVNSNI